MWIESCRTSDGLTYSNRHSTVYSKMVVSEKVQGSRRKECKCKQMQNANRDLWSPSQGSSSSNSPYWLTSMGWYIWENHTVCSNALVLSSRSSVRKNWTNLRQRERRIVTEQNHPKIVTTRSKNGKLTILLFSPLNYRGRCGINYVDPLP